MKLNLKQKHLASPTGVSPELSEALPDSIVKSKFLAKLSRKLERPMLLLSFVWLIVIIVELVNGMSPLLLTLGTALWASFILYLCLRFVTVPDRRIFLRRNWLFIPALLVPILRFVPELHSLPIVRILTATFGIQVVWIFASADQGLRSIRRAVGRKGVGYVLTFAAVVIMAGAAGMLHFEQDVPNPQGIHTYPKALWWVAMQLTNIGSGYQPVTTGGLALCLGISVFAVGIFGYLTAVFAAIIIGRDTVDPKTGVHSLTSVNLLSDEVALLRKSIEDVIKLVPKGILESEEQSSMSGEGTQIDTK